MVRGACRVGAARGAAGTGFGAFSFAAKAARWSGVSAATKASRSGVVAPAGTDAEGAGGAPSAKIGTEPSRI
jgi:hypothetical protein